ncbi:aldo/keto reductase [Paenibacillus radicis (ex Xue et al. 2023)]|uniref:Aldo/keto reductase n=1 Tax=Paenibacillus radicis (ex Xue et al. 2023) TaxID=2972489 RepID=A0ABT1YPB4_9BACL|nr:aldo/keto reductase [Paenibacillus radicis (ex Xue et al. 2023)]MCR8635012.1 aldo/keto reductase [Paenibacillus radicis (ex Xue et al. 2023)]
MKTISIKGLYKPCGQLIMGSDHFNQSQFGLANSLLDKFTAMGGTTIDTAFQYGDGESEKTIGRWIHERNNREQVVILTKGAHHDETGHRVNPQSITHDLNISLERLQTDYIDLYALHRDDPNVPVGPIIDILNEHLLAGKILALGASNWSHQRIQEANDYAQQNGLTGFTFSSTNLSLAKMIEPRWAGCVPADEKTCQWHQATGMPLLSWSSLGAGFMADRFSPEHREDEEMVRTYYSEGNWQRLERTRQLSKEKGVPSVQLALAYVLNQPFPTCALVAAYAPEELDSNLAAAGLTLTPEEVRWLEFGEK